MKHPLETLTADEGSNNFFDHAPCRPAALDLTQTFSRKMMAESMKEVRAREWYSCTYRQKFFASCREIVKFCCVDLVGGWWCRATGVGGN